MSAAVIELILATSAEARAQCDKEAAVRALANATERLEKAREVVQRNQGPSGLYELDGELWDVRRDGGAVTVNVKRLSGMGRSEEESP